jgi:hypothetical protein
MVVLAHQMEAIHLIMVLAAVVVQAQLGRMVQVQAVV